MDFFSGNEIVLLIWGIGILHFIFRWMKERRSSDRSTEAVSIMECSGDTENRFHQYLSKPLRERKTKPMAVEPITAPKAAQAAADWSEETVRTWAKYDVVFGEPRGRRPWTPFVRH